MLPASLPIKARSMILLALLPTNTRSTTNSSPNRMISLYALRPCPLLRSRTSGTPEVLSVGEFRVSTRNILCGVSLRGVGPGRMGVDERVEGASEVLPGFILLDVDQVDQVAPVHPFVEPHGGATLSDDPDFAPGEGDGVRTVSTMAVNAVNLHGDPLEHPSSFSRRSGRDGGAMPRPDVALTETLTPRPLSVINDRGTLR